MLKEIVWQDEQEAAFFAAQFGIADSPLQHLGRNRAFIHIKERHVIVGNLVQKDDELHQVRISLLPERLPAPAKQVVDQGGDTVGQGVRVEAVVQGVVAVLGTEADFDVVVFASSAREHGMHLPAKISLYFEHQTANPFFWVSGLIGEDLFGIRIKARARLSAADSADNGNAREQAALGDGEPPRGI